MKKNTAKWFLVCAIMAIALAAVAVISLVSPETSEAVAVPEEQTQTAEETAAEKKAAKEEVEKELSTLVNDYLYDQGVNSAMVGIAVHDFESDASFMLNADAYFTAGSTYKLPLAMLFYEMVEDGDVALKDGLYYNLSYYEEGGAVGETYKEGDYVRILDLLHAVIVDSDNTAAHILYEYLGGWTAFKEAISKYSSTPIDEEDTTYYSYYNEFTASYMNDVLDYLYNHQDTFETLISDMKEAKPDDYLNGVIGGAKMAQKYGQYEEAENAIGFSTSGHPYSIAVYTSMGYTGRVLIGELNARIWDYFNEENGAETNTVEAQAE